MAPTEGRFAMPAWRWGCRRGTPANMLCLQICQVLFNIERC